MLKLGFWFGVWLIFLTLVALIPCITLGMIRAITKREEYHESVEYYYSKWFNLCRKFLD